MAGRKQVHGKVRNMRNIRNKKGRSRKSAPIRNRERVTINSENTKRRIKRTKRGHSGRIICHMERRFRIHNIQGCTLFSNFHHHLTNKIVLNFFHIFLFLGLLFYFGLSIKSHFTR
jgi:hypothetical protein